MTARRPNPFARARRNCRVITLVEGLCDFTARNREGEVPVRRMPAPGRASDHRILMPAAGIEAVIRGSESRFDGDGRARKALHKSKTGGGINKKQDGCRKHPSCPEFPTLASPATVLTGEFQRLVIVTSPAAPMAMMAAMTMPAPAVSTPVVTATPAYLVRLQLAGFGSAGDGMVHALDRGIDLGRQGRSLRIPGKHRNACDCHRPKNKFQKIPTFHGLLLFSGSHHNDGNS